MPAVRSRAAANELSINSIALALSMDRQTVGKRLDAANAIPQGTKGKARYRLLDVIRALAADVGANSEAISYSDQLAISRTRKTEVETQAAELKLQTAAGTLIHKSVAIEMVEKLTITTDHFLLTLADQLEIDAGLSGAQVEKMNEAIRGQRRRLVDSINA